MSVIFRHEISLWHSPARARCFHFCMRTTRARVYFHDFQNFSMGPIFRRTLLQTLWSYCEKISHNPSGREQKSTHVQESQCVVVNFLQCFFQKCENSMLGMFSSLQSCGEKGVSSSQMNPLKKHVKRAPCVKSPLINMDVLFQHVGWAEDHFNSDATSDEIIKDGLSWSSDSGMWDEIKVRPKANASLILNRWFIRPCLLSLAVRGEFGQIVYTCSIDSESRALCLRTQ